MNDVVCYCINCSPEKKFYPSQCAFCEKEISGEGKLTNPNGARICMGCRDKCFKLLEESGGNI